ncbi:predicted protein [Lichtheimia corymbifera JMRC:FSU:9682]|uniref:Uncharacterized protein n=1 Tax=Lichtheimia corymbifera JMRC:FSU:9682 TaxID=1263082 RepID=A0A068SHD0_9FUNG|nr:predicted protein [Lichtheimia corymbifera JMRC:FSU:9682]
MTHTPDQSHYSQEEEQSDTFNQPRQISSADVLRQIETALQQIAETQKAILQRLDSYDSMSIDSRNTTPSSSSFHSMPSQGSSAVDTQRTSLISRPTQQKPGTTKKKLTKAKKEDIIRLVIDPKGEKGDELITSQLRTIGSYARTPHDNRDKTIKFFEQTVLDKLGIDLGIAERSWVAEHLLSERWDNKHYYRKNPGRKNRSATTQQQHGDRNREITRQQQHGREVVSPTRTLSIATNHMLHPMNHNEEQVNASASQNYPIAMSEFDAINSSLRDNLNNTPATSSASSDHDSSSFVSSVDRNQETCNTLTDVVERQQNQTSQQSQGGKRRSLAEDPSFRRSRRTPKKRTPMSL